jgi:hypothetical protein
MMLFSALRMNAHGGTSPGRYGSLFPLTITALRVVYGDIGTSPLYAIRECFFGSHSVGPTHENVLGVLSLVLYALLLVISVKYTSLVMRADNQGEGGILSLNALLPSRNGTRNGLNYSFLVALGIIGASLLCGEGMITPAVSIMSAIEGLQVATPLFSAWVVPISVAILVVLFLIQRHGTHRVGGLFGPVMVVWFITIAILGFRWIIRAPEVLQAFDPRHAVTFFVEHGWHGFAVLGAVVLVVTGAEALYADMGHFGRRPIRMAWFGLVLPALLINYFGQGALVLINGDAARKPFFMMAPSWAPAAAGRALDCRRDHCLPGADLWRVLADAPSHSAGAPSRHPAHVVDGDGPGVCAAGELVSRHLHCPRHNGLPVLERTGGGLRHRRYRDDGHYHHPAFRRRHQALELAHTSRHRRSADFSRSGRLAFRRQSREDSAGWMAAARDWRAALYVDDNVEDGQEAGSGTSDGARISTRRLHGRGLVRSADSRVGDRGIHDGAAQGHTSGASAQPSLQQILHEHMIVLMVRTAHTPYVPPSEQVEVQSLGCGVYSVRVQYGFMQDPAVPSALLMARERGVELDVEDLTYFLGRETIIVTQRPGMAAWREKLFVVWHAMLSAQRRSSTCLQSASLNLEYR